MEFKTIASAGRVEVRGSQSNCSGSVENRSEGHDNRNNQQHLFFDRFSAIQRGFCPVWSQTSGLRPDVSRAVPALALFCSHPEARDLTLGCQAFGFLLGDDLFDGWKFWTSFIRFWMIPNIHIIFYSTVTKYVVRLCSCYFGAFGLVFGRHHTSSVVHAWSKGNRAGIPRRAVARLASGPRTKTNKQSRQQSLHQEVRKIAEFWK